MYVGCGAVFMTYLQTMRSAFSLPWGLAAQWVAMALLLIPLVLGVWLHGRRRQVTTRLAVRDGVLTIDGERYAELSDLRLGGVLGDAAGAIRVVFFRRSRRPYMAAAVDPVILRVESRAEGDQLLRALGIDAHTQRMELATYTEWRTWHVALALPLYLGLAAAVAVPLFAWVEADEAHAASMPLIVLQGPTVFSMSMTALLLGSLSWQRVSVGLDGIGVDRTYSRRFFPFSDIRDVVLDGRTLRLELVSGESIQLLKRALLESSITGRVMIQALLLERIRSELSRRSASPAADVELARGKQAAAEWVAKLRAIGDGRVHYRTGATTIAVLENALADAHTDPSTRLGAALALRIADPSSGPRILAAAATSGASAFRTALRAIAHDPRDARLATALDAAARPFDPDVGP